MRGPVPIPLYERFDRIGWDVTPGGCWEWRGTGTAGYGLIRSGTPRSRSSLRAHRVAFERWHRPLRDGEIVRHTCDNPPCVNPDHLMPGTHADNVADKLSRGRGPKGETHGRSTLTSEQVVDIRNRLRSGERQKDVAQKYGVNNSTISMIALGNTWRHLLTTDSYIKTSRTKPR